MSMFAPVASARSHRRPLTRKTLMMSCAAAALAAGVLAPQKARAQVAPQGYAGTINSSGGINAGTSTSSAIYVTDQTATIDWTPTDNDGTGNIVFLPSSETVNYYGPGFNYTVLNRILPSNSNRPIELNGAVNSFIGDTGSATGGNIWFYSPGGILIGSGAVFDVGGLLLTTNGITSFGQGPDGFDATFIAGSPTAKIQIASGAQLKALQQNSYIALVAPRIEQGGDLRTGGSAALVAGNQVSMTMNQGLFDIRVDLGTDDSQGIVHTGTTTGKATGSKIYMMALPKNQALTMAVGGTVGFDATSASVLNGQIVLTSGIAQVDDIPDPYTFYGLGDNRAGMTLDNLHLTSNAQITSMGDGQITTVDGDDTFDGNLFMSSYYGNLAMTADGGTITAKGATYLSTSSLDFFFNSGDSDDRQAGNIDVSALNGGAISTRDLNLSANGKGEDNEGRGTALAGAGHGGNISIVANVDSSITVAGSLTASAKGLGGNMRTGSTAAGDGRGGDINVYGADGTIAVTGDLSLDAGGWGGAVGQDNQGNNLNLTSGTGGNGYGGYVTLHTSGANGKVTVGDPNSPGSGATSLYADGYGGNAQTGGDGYGGTVSAYADDGAVDLGGVFRLFARGFGGAASYGFGGDGG
ncbi:MAG: hypothetical protein LH624_03890, partial [Cryobacterium sp.]|nr:hypothetical protein [Cryobacterium sp.]